jgi:acyl carrier protein
MTYPEIVNAIHQVLREIMTIPQIGAFNEKARLNEDLYLDSVLVLELILNLETELGLDIPDEALTKDEFDTVTSLAAFLDRRIIAPHKSADKQEASETLKAAEEFEDIKVHCFVSCICEIIKDNPRVDHRPFYFGVWDSEVVINDQFQLSYHAENINHNFFKNWYQKLYGVEMHSWYRPQKSKAENINTLLTLLHNKSEQCHVMVMLDLYRLPERENKFNQNPFPHYVLLNETADPEIWFMTDPDFRWQGSLAKDKILNAIDSPAVSGGYYFNSNDIEETTRQDIHDYFIACIKPDHNPMTDAIRSIIDVHLHPQSQRPLTALSDALKQIPVLAIRKYAYEHGFAYFWREMDLNDASFEQWCELIEVLVETYKLIQFTAMKIAKFDAIEHSIEASSKEGLQPLIDKIYRLLDQQDQREFSIKQQLITVFRQWQERHIALSNRTLSNKMTNNALKREEVDV